MAMSTLTGCPCFKAGLPSSSIVYRSVRMMKVENLSRDHTTLDQRDRRRLPFYKISSNCHSKFTGLLKVITFKYMWWICNFIKYFIFLKLSCISWWGRNEALARRVLYFHSAVRSVLLYQFFPIPGTVLSSGHQDSWGQWSYGGCHWCQ